MQVQFEATSDDFIDVNLRSIRRSNTIASNRRRARIMAGIIAGLLVFVLVPFSTLVQSVSGLSAFLIAFIIYPRIYERNLERSIKKIYQEEMGDTGSIHITVEISEEGLLFRQLGTEIKYDWSIIKEIEIFEDRIDFILKRGNMATVRERAFNSPEHRIEFINLSRTLIEQYS